MTEKQSEEVKQILRRLNWELPEPLDVPKFKNAACVGMPTEWWFPDKHPSAQMVMNTRKAIQICNSCAEQKECADFAIDNPGVQGIWGGMSTKLRVRTRTAIQKAHNVHHQQGFVYSEARKALEAGPHGHLSI